MINAGIIGGAGYTGGELIRILLNHPQVNIGFVHSKSNAGNFIYHVHHDLIGETELKFTGELNNDVDLLFLCVGHGDAKIFLEENNIDRNIKIIDLSQDFRLNKNSTLAAHGFKRNFVYGLPELNKEIIKNAENIANPGCFATAMQLAMLPLAEKNILTDDIHISGITGSTGAGQSLSLSSHFSWRNNNTSVYKAFTHQHLNETTESFKQLQKTFSSDINFIPYRGNFSRGIIVTAYTKCTLDIHKALDIYNNFYADHYFTVVSDRNTDLKQVVNTNKCVLHLEKHNDNLMIISNIDNLLKGASGQAVQNMNIMFGLNESEGLKLKSIAF